MSQFQLTIHTNSSGCQHYILNKNYYISLNDADFAYRVEGGNFPDGLGAYLHRIDLDRSYVTSNGDTVIQAAEGQDSYFRIQPTSYLKKIALDSLPKKEEGQGVLW